MEPQFDFGMIGIGVMGSNLLLNMADAGFAVIGYDLKEERARALEAAANKGTIVKGTTDLHTFVSGLKHPRKIMMLVPAGKPVDAVIASLLPLVGEGDILIDGGNSFYRDTEARIRLLQDKGIHFFGMGVSGGEMGARTGPSMMPGGDKAAWKYLQPLLESIAAKADGHPCVDYMGAGAAGHYVKMVHNGIEYAMMQMIAEVYDILRRGAGYDNAKLGQTFRRWNEGELQSFLIEITAEIFTTQDEDGLPLLDRISDKAGSKGTGKWTSQGAMDLHVPVPSIDMAVAMRDLSVFSDIRKAAAARYALVPQFAEAGNLEEDMEDALAFSFVMAYAQGLHMLSLAATELAMEIPLPAVIRVWKGGCIIRSALLGNFEKALAGENGRVHLLLDEGIAALLKSWEGAARRIVAQAVTARIPVAALSSAIAYFDAFGSARLPINLVQAQRDYFGAHTYTRIDKEGVFHTEWNK